MDFRLAVKSLPMKTHPVFVVFFCTVLSIISCSNGANSNITQDNVALSEPPPTQEDVAAGREAKVNPTERKVIKTGILRAEVDELENSRDQLSALVKKQGGMISNESSTKESDREEVTLQVKVPAAQFDAFVASLEKIVKQIDQKELNSSDVTSEYIDIQARLHTKVELEKRYLQLLQRASKVEEVLSIERELANVRADIESMQGQLNYFNKQVQYSSLTLTLYESKLESTPFFSQVGPAFHTGWQLLLGFFLILFRLWPLYVFGGVVYFIVRKKNRGQ